MSNSVTGSRLDPDARRAQIVDVAAGLLAQDGVDALTIPGVARAAGVARALAYHYFSGRDALLEAVWRREATSLLAATEPEPAASSRANVERALAAYLDHFAASSGALRELYVPGAATPPVVRELAASNHAVQVARVLSVLDLGGTPRHRLAVRGWLALVEEAARSCTAGDVARDEVVALCCDALEAVTDVRLHPGPPR